MSSDGVVNQVLSAVGLGGVTRAWLGDFSYALPAVGVIGTWVLLGFCTVLLLVGMSKIDPALYEAAAARRRRARSASSSRSRFRALRQEIGVCVTVTVIAALSAFDIVYISTQRRARQRRRWFPGLKIYQLAFFNREVGLASALAVVLMLLVLICILPIQWFVEQGRQNVIVARRTHVAQRAALLLVLMAGRSCPFASLFTTALHQSGTYPSGLDWPSHPHWGNFVERVPRREHGDDLQVERADRARRRARHGRHRDDGRLRARPSARSSAAGSSSCSSCSA